LATSRVWADGMAEVAEMLRQWHLDMYIEKMAEMGFDDRSWLLSPEFSEEQLGELVVTVGMKAGHAQKFRDYLEREKAKR